MAILGRAALLATAVCLAAGLSSAQNPSPAPPAAASRPHESAKPQLTDLKAVPGPGKAAPALKGVSSGSPEDAAHKVADDLAAKKKDAAAGQPKADRGAEKLGVKTQAAAASASSPADAIGEFQPVPSGADSSTLGTKTGSRGKTSRGSQIHGEVYGAGSVLGRDTGGAVGTTSKSGKTSVYVQSDDAKGAANPPQ